MNKAILTGRITDNLEIKKTQSNKSVVNYSIAVDKGTKDEFGNRQATFIEIQSWNQQAEFLAQYAGKGALISVVGRIENSSYTNNENVKVKKTYVVSENVEILNKPNKEIQQPIKKEQDNEVQQSIRKEQDNFGASFSDIKSDDLPFY